MDEQMKPSEALRKTRELITPEGAWTQDVAAINAEGDWLDYGFEEGAVCWCITGAVEHTENVKWHKSTCYAAIYKLPEMRHGVADWNDDPDRTHAEVLAALDKAIALAEAEGR